jgi:hypothetical protein|tara:strand:- start:126 stop:407 length:282 start_codon:yes stop_codon:yes gene_type:complete
MSWEYTDGEGFTLRVFSSMYVDWGTELTAPDGYGLHYSPSSLSVESYGFHWEDEDGQELDEGKPWTDEEWKEALQDELVVFREVYEGTVYPEL